MTEESSAATEELVEALRGMGIDEALAREVCFTTEFLGSGCDYVCILGIILHSEYLCRSCLRIPIFQ